MILWLFLDFVLFYCWRELSILAHTFSMSYYFILTFFILFFVFYNSFIDWRSGSKQRLIFDAWHQLTNSHGNTAVAGHSIDTLVEEFLFSRALGQAVPKIPLGKSMIFILNNFTDLTLFLLFQCLILLLVVLVMLGTYVSTRYYFVEGAYFLFFHDLFIFIANHNIHNEAQSPNN